MKALHYWMAFAGWSIAVLGWITTMAMEGPREAAPYFVATFVAVVWMRVEILLMKVSTPEDEAKNT